MPAAIGEERVGPGRAGWLAGLLLVLAAGCTPKTEGAADDDGDGFTEADGDCDDFDPGVFPGAGEHCDGADENCDGVVDEAPVDAPTWYPDGDEDGFGAGAGTAACEAPAGAVAEDGDCDDGDRDRHPGADEHCDGVDEDCDEATDEDAVDGTVWYPDNDADGWGSDEGAERSCAGAPGPDWSEEGGDCDDGSASAHPSAPELCGNGHDDDCDGDEDEVACDSWAFPAVDVADVIESTSARVTGGGRFSLAAGDADGRGEPDLLVSLGGQGFGDTVGWIFTGEAALPANDTGAAYTVSSSTLSLTEAVVTTAWWPDLYGGDGALLVGVPGEGLSGYWYTIEGPIRGDVDVNRDWRFGIPSGNTGDRAGSALLAGPDYDGDGIADAVVGALGFSRGTGLVKVYAGGDEDGWDMEGQLCVIGGLSEGDELGFVLVDGGDLDGDGAPDLLAGAPGGRVDTYTPGYVSVILGGTCGDDDGVGDFPRLTGELEGDRTGAGVAGGLDLGAGGTLDGVPDLVVGAPGLAADAPGKTWLVPGGSWAHTAGDYELLDLATARWEGDAPGAHLGASAGLPGDLDGDGVSEIAVAAPGDRDGITSFIGLWGGGAASGSAPSVKVQGDCGGDDQWGDPVTSGVVRDGVPTLTWASRCEEGGGDAPTVQGIYLWEGPWAGSRG